MKLRNLHSSSLSRSSIGERFFLFGIGLTGALTVGLLGLVTFCVVGFVAVATVGFVAFFSVGTSVGLARGTVGLIAGFAGRFSVLRK